MSLALADFFCSGNLVDGFLISNGFIFSSYNSFDCKFRKFLQILGNDASPLTLTLISIERLFSVVVPHKVKNIFTRKVAIILVLIVWTISLGTTCLYAYINVFVITPHDQPMCVIPQVQMRVPYQITTIINQIVKFGSWLINISCMIVITRALLQNSFASSGKSVKTPIKSVTLSLLTVNVVYFLFMTPIVMHDGYTMAFSDARITMFEFYNLLNVNNILSFFSNINNVLNIFIYFLIGAKFREYSKEFLLSFKMFRMCCRGKK
jgi:hypothetical protein